MSSTVAMHTAYIAKGAPGHSNPSSTGSSFAAARTYRARAGPASSGASSQRAGVLVSVGRPASAQSWMPPPYLRTLV